jgi:hypothetical protein
MASRKSQSAGLLLFRGRAADLEVLLGHPGGPFWQTKDEAAWSIPKGLIGVDEAPYQPLGANSPKRPDTTRREISCHSAIRRGKMPSAMKAATQA